MPSGPGWEGECESDLLCELVLAGRYGSAEEREESLALQDGERGGWPPVRRVPCFLVSLERRVAGHAWVGGDGQQLRFSGRYAFEGTGRGVFDGRGRLRERQQGSDHDSGRGDGRGGAAAGTHVAVSGVTAVADGTPAKAAVQGRSTGSASSAHCAPRPSLPLSPAGQTAVHRLMAVARGRGRGGGRERNVCVLPTVPFRGPHKPSDLLRDVAMDKRWCLNEVRKIAVWVNKLGC